MRLPRALSRAPTLLTYAIVVFALALAILWLIPANYVILMPGSAQPTCSLVKVQGRSCQASAGGVYDTYVNELNANHLLYVVLALFRPDVTVSPAQDVTGNCPTGEYQNQLIQMMADSKIEAEASALNAAGYRLQTQKWAPQVLAVNCGIPAASKLQSGDRIMAVDGHAITGKLSDGRPWPCGSERGQVGCSLFQQIHHYVGLHRPGGIVRLTILRNGVRRVIPVQTVAATAGGVIDPSGTHTLIGVEMTLPFRFPVKVNINSGDVGGPSAGLAFALAIYQELTDQNLTHGNRVAVTGQINYVQVRQGNKVAWEGVVSPIGGAKQKAIAAQAAGAKYFLVPPANYNDAKSAGTDLVIKTVSSLKQAITVLKSLPPARTASD